MAHIQSVLHEIRPFNIQYMVHLYKLTQTTAHMLAKQDTVLFLGYTGSGKSTTIHFMCGSKFHRNIDDHFEVIDPAKACEAINTRYAVSESVTKSIAAVSINLKDYGVNTYGTDAKTNVMLCDTPGFLDAGGPEIDVANGLGIVNAVRKAKSLRIIITVDWMACTGNRMDALKKLAYTLANIVPNYKKYQSYIDFIFTKVPPKEQDYTKIRRKVEQALEENQKQNAHDSALIDFLLMLRNNRNPIFLNPMQSDLKETMQDLFVGKDWISVPSQVIKSFVTDESMMQIKQQISKHKQYIMRTMNRYQNARHDMGSQCTEQTQCSADSVGSGLEFGLIDIKLSELSQLHQCLPDIQIIKDTLNECIEIIRKAFNMKINEAITKLSNSNRYHNIYEFEKSIINFKMITNDMGAMMNLQQKHFENNIGASPLLLNESLTNAFEYSLNKCSLSFDSAIYFEKIAIFGEYFEQFKVACSQKMNQMNEALDKITADTIEYVQQHDVETYSNLRVLSKAMHLNVNDTIDYLEKQLIASLNGLLVNLESHFIIKNISSLEWIDHDIQLNKINDTIHTLQTFHDQLNALQDVSFIHSKISPNIKLIYSNATKVMVDYCHDLNDIVKNILAVTPSKEMHVQNTLKNAKSAMTEFKNIISMNDDVKMQTASIYYQTTSLIINYLTSIQDEFTNIVARVENDIASPDDYMLLNTYVQIINHSDWIFEIAGKSKENELIKHITQQLRHRINKLEHEAKRISPSIHDPEALQLIKNVLDKLSKIRFLQEFIADISTMSERVISLVQNDVRRILGAIMREYSPNQPNSNHLLTGLLDEMDILIRSNENSLMMTKPIEQIVVELQHQLEDIDSADMDLLNQSAELNMDAKQEISRQRTIYTEFEQLANKMKDEGLLIHEAMDIDTLKATLLNEINNNKHQKHKYSRFNNKLNYKKISKCLTFINACRPIPWEKQLNENVHHENMNVIASHAHDTVIQYLHEYVMSQDKLLRGSFNALVDIDNGMNHSTLLSHMETLSDILFEYDAINKRKQEYGDIVDYLYQDTNVWANWVILIKQKFRDLQIDLQTFSRTDTSRLSVAIQRARILNRIDWFLESHFSIRNGFGSLHSEYLGILLDATNLDQITSALEHHSFVQAADLIESLYRFKDAHERKRYQHAQSRLTHKAFEIYDSFKSQIMHLTRSFETNTLNDDVNAVLQQYKFIKDIKTFCHKYMVDQDIQTLSAIFSKAISSLDDHINDISSRSTQFIASRTFAAAEQLSVECNTIVSRLSDLFGATMHNLSKTCQTITVSLNNKLRGISEQFIDGIHFDDKTIKRRTNLYGIHGLPSTYKALMDGSTRNVKYSQIWNDIQDDINIKFRDLLRKSENANWEDSVNILHLCDAILNSLPPTTRDVLRADYKATQDLIKAGNKKETQQLQQFLIDDDISSVHQLFLSMKEAGNRKMMRAIQNALSDKARQTQAHLDQAIANEKVVKMKHNLVMLHHLNSGLPSNAQSYKHLEMQYVNAKTKIDTFISDKIHDVKRLMFAIKRECIKELHRNLDILLSLFGEDSDQNTKILRDKVNDYNERISVFVNRYFDAQMETFSDALKRLDSIELDKSLNTMQLFDSKQSDIILKLDSFDHVQVNEEANYVKMVSKTVDKLHDTQKQIVSIGLINTNIQRNVKSAHYKYFLDLKAQLQSLKQSAALKSHIDGQKLTTLYEICVNTLRRDLEEMIKELKKTLKADDRVNEGVCDYINDHYRILLALNEADIDIFSAIDDNDDDNSFSGKVKKMLKFNRNKSRLQSNIDDITGLIEDKLSSLQTNIRRVINSVRIGSDKIDTVIDILIEMEIFNTIVVDFHDSTQFKIENSLQAFKEEHPAEITSLYKLLNRKQNAWANIIQSYSIFNAIAVSQFNKATAPYGIEHVLKHIHGIGDDINTKSKKDVLRSLFINFKQRYEQVVDQYLLPPDRINLIPLISKIKTIPGDLKQSQKHIVWDLKTKEKAINLMSYIFALWTLQNSKSYFEVADKTDARSYLMTPHDAQVISIFRLLGLGNTAKSYSAVVLSELKELASKWSFGLYRSHKQAETLMPNLVEIGTGEGKSLTLAVSSAVLALLGFHVDCACYSKYLSVRDYKDFESLFISLDIHHHIKYGTFNELSENIINEDGNIRDIVTDLMLTEDEQKSGANKCYSPKRYARANVLLIDEVDVFFNKQFYGQFYTPGAVLKHECIKGITDYIWNHYTKNGNQSILTLSAIKATNEYEECVKVFEWADIIDEQVKCMLADINTFESPKYVVRNDKIGYKEGDQISYTATVGYKTLFAYYHEHYNHNNVISTQSLENMTAMYLKCGTFSYAEIPKRFNVIMGVTGTLKHLSRSQLQIMDQDYGLKVHSYMPSLFGINKHKFDEDEDIKITMIEQFNEALKNEIIKRLKDHAPAKRCVFVFFDDRIKLMSFYNSNAFIAFHDRTRIITEQLTFKEKEAEIKRAPQSNRITLLTKPFGRGTDFKVMDDAVKNNGGPHVIQTFVSLELSEQIQIRGRTARQGGDGSYSMVLIDEELEKFGITKEDIETAEQKHDLYGMIQTKRTAEFAKEYMQVLDRIKTAKEVHESGEEFLRALHNNDIDKVKEDLLSYNVGPATGSVKIAICVDATGSMTSLLESTKTRIREMFRRIRDILHEHHIDTNRFQIQLIAYRNYNAPAEELLLSSGWQNDPNELDKFLKHVPPDYGWGNEAVEVALEFVNNDPLVDEMIIIGDAPPNTKAEVIKKRNQRKQSYWETTKYKTAVYFDDELIKLKSRGLKINSFYLREGAKNEFEKMAQTTGGNCERLDIDSSEGGEQLTRLISTTVLNVCGGEQQGAQLVKAYDAKFTHIS
eukprot:812004_1